MQVTVLARLCSTRVVILRWFFLHGKHKTKMPYQKKNRLSYTIKAALEKWLKIHFGWLFYLYINIFSEFFLELTQQKKLQTKVFERTFHGHKAKCVNFQLGLCKNVSESLIMIMLHCRIFVYRYLSYSANPLNIMVLEEFH